MLGALAASLPSVTAAPQAPAAGPSAPLAAPGELAPARREAGSPFAAQEQQGERRRFGEADRELASTPEEEDTYSVDSGTDSFVPVVSWGVAAAQGRRQTMEDAHIGVSGADARLDDASRSFFGLFDGHGGVSAAEYARDHLLELVTSDDAFEQRPGEALNSAFLALDERFYQAVQSRAQAASGSTLLAALLCGPQLLVANAGDSRAVLSRRGRAVALSRDHRPNADVERLRITGSGGFVCGEGFLNGVLGVSRGIGDYHLEGLKRKPSPSQPLEGPMTAEPEISTHSLKPEDEFLLLACDGLWDVLPSQRAVELARQFLQQHANDPGICAQMLVDKSLELHASDNVTVMVVCLSTAAPPKREFGEKVRRSVSQNGLNTLRSALREAH